MSDLTIGLDTSDYDVVGDLVRGDLDLVTGNDLKTSILVSLFTDRDWWANLYEPDTWGSDLSTLLRAKHSEATRLKARDFCRIALAWLIEDQVASAVDVNTGWIGNTLAIGIVVTEPSGAKTGLNVSRGIGATQYSYVWKEV